MIEDYRRVFSSPFSRLLDDLAEVDRERKRERENQRFVKSLFDGAQRAKRAGAELLAKIGGMAKSLEADRVQRALAERTEFRTRLADAIAQADAACAAGLLTADQASHLDLQIGSLQRRAAEMESAP